MELIGWIIVACLISQLIWDIELNLWVIERNKELEKRVRSLEALDIAYKGLRILLEDKVKRDKKDTAND